jgi:hypothetical protein
MASRTVISLTPDWVLAQTYLNMMEKMGSQQKCEEYAQLAFENLNKVYAHFSTIESASDKLEQLALLKGEFKKLNSLYAQASHAFSSYEPAFNRLSDCKTRIETLKNFLDTRDIPDGPDTYEKVIIAILALKIEQADVHQKEVANECLVDIYHCLESNEICSGYNDPQERIMYDELLDQFKFLGNTDYNTKCDDYLKAHPTPVSDTSIPENDLPTAQNMIDALIKNSSALINKLRENAERKNLGSLMARMPKHLRVKVDQTQETLRKIQEFIKNGQNCPSDNVKSFECGIQDLSAQIKRLTSLFGKKEKPAQKDH